METIWIGSVQDIVARVAASDARETFVDEKTGAKIRINIDGGDFEETDEPFYIEHGENLFDAYDRKEAVRILSNIRKGEKYPDMDIVSTAKPKKKTKSKSKSRTRVGNTSMRRVR